MRASLDNIVTHLRKHYPQLNIIVEADVWKNIASRHPYLIPAYSRASNSLLAHTDERSLLTDKTDFIITLGGDGSVLHVSSLFDKGPVPPVLSFSLGTLGFLLPYDISSFPAAIDDVLHARFSLFMRMRMCLTLWGANPDQCLYLPGEKFCRELHFMNEVVLHRGREPHMTTMDAFVNCEHLTRTVADGLILSTPTGSTAYSLSTGGPIVHPNVSTMLLTPISPRSLSFRTILLPNDARVQVFVARGSRSPAEVSVDGRVIHTLAPLESACVEMSPYFLPCVHFGPKANAARRIGDVDAETPAMILDDWVYDINSRLRFNAPFQARDQHSSSDAQAMLQTYSASLRRR